MYVEPFCGSAALFFSLESNSATLSDLNSDLINFYSVLRADPVGLHREAAAIPRNEQTYYATRLLYNKCTDSFLRAAYFYFLNKNCFNGLFRTSLTGNFNVPYSGARTGEYPSISIFLEAAELLKGATLISGDFEVVVARALSRRCLVYLDPPYASGTRQPFAAYHPNSFSPLDLDRLESLLDHIDRKGSTFILTYSDEKAISGRFARWQRRAHVVRRNISGFAGARKLTAETLFTNGALSHA
jgi:DNA adenine methylase